LLLILKFQQLKGVLFSFHIIDKPLEDLLFGNFDMGPGLRVQIKRELRDLRFVSVGSLIGKYLFGV
jgi:hypothetical protein